MKKLFVLLTVCWLLMLSGCKSDEPGEKAKVAPTNLIINKTISVDGSGLVQFTATAQDAILYSYLFGEVGETALPSATGIIQHTYQNSGTYNVRVLAYSADNLSLEGSVSVTVDVIKIEPTDLAVETTISDDGSGLVTFNASATDAESFSFYFDESSAQSDVIDTDGTLAHNFMESGTYNVKVKAISVDNISIETTVDVNVSVTISDAGASSPLTYTGMNLVWQDEFSGDALSSDWAHETGGNGWGNNELEYYQPANTKVANGYLSIKAIQENVGGKLYTSSRIVTKGKQEFTYGRIDIRARLPKGQGLWPALWMLGANISTTPWPACGEIDIMEIIGGGAGRDNKLYGTPHWSNAGAYASAGGNTTLSSGIFADEFHVFSIAWDNQNIKWLLDGAQYHIINITPAELNEFQKDFFFIFNVAVGGNWPGSPNASTTFPQQMLVDYIRVFQTAP